MLHFRFALPVVLTVAAMLTSTSCIQKTFPVRTYPMGDRVILGHLIYTVFESQWLTQIGDGETARIPQNRFFLVRLSVTNSGGEPVVAPNLTVQDDNGSSAPELSNGEGVPQWIGYLRQIDPADSAQGNLVFDVPPKHYRLRITDEDGQRPALIDIPLSFSSESPEIPNPNEQKK